MLNFTKQTYEIVEISGADYCYQGMNLHYPAGF